MQITYYNNELFRIVCAKILRTLKAFESQFWQKLLLLRHWPRNSNEVTESVTDFCSINIRCFLSHFPRCTLSILAFTPYLPVCKLNTQLHAIVALQVCSKKNPQQTCSYSNPSPLPVHQSYELGQIKTCSVSQSNLRAIKHILPAFW